MPRAARPVGRFRSRSRQLQLEHLESRNLLSFSFGGITIPSIPGLPTGLPSITLPSFTNQFNLGSLTSYLNPPASDDWWLKNTGQTLSNPTSGPATGTPGADIDAQDAWNITTGNSNVVIAVLDTGIDLNNADLASVLWTNPGEIPGDGIDNDGDGLVDDVHGWNFLNNSNDVSDNFVHGTAVAATIHSVAPGVTILPVEIGTADGVDSQNVIDGINYIIGLKNAGVNIVAINASYISFTPPSQGEVSAIQSAGDHGMLYIAAAGNAGMNLDNLIPDVPAALAKYIPNVLPSNLIFVAATDNQDNLASFSDYGARTVSVGAPGVNITLPLANTDGLYAPLSGTSFAAPMVSGIVGLLKSKFPNASMSDIKDAILKSGDLDPALAGKTVTGRRVDAFKALNYMMGNQAPTGAVEVLNNTTISGWAFDPNLGAGAASVKITMDGQTVAMVQASASRDDLADSLGSADHGFSFDMTSTPYGKHVFKVYVIDDATGKQTLIGQGNITVNTLPIGSLDAADTKTVTGWAFDSDTPTKALTVKLFLDGKSWVSTTAKVARPDLTDIVGTGNHGYQFSLGTMKAGIHRIDVYAVDSLTGALTLLGSDTISSNRPATGAVETLNATTISGWAFDADAGSGAIQVQYIIDDMAPVCVTANLARPDLQTQLGSKNHGFNITLPQLTAGEHHITVNAVDPNNKSLVQLDSETLNIADPDGNPLPSGQITFGTSAITGTLADGDNGPIHVRIDIVPSSGSPVSYTTTATQDPDTLQYTFTFNLPTFSGPRRVDVFALDDQTGTPVLVDRQLVNYNAPAATLESFDTTAAIGYAFAPSAANMLATLRLDVDDLTGNLVTANGSRPDLQSTFGKSSVGFDIPVPKMAPGEHTLTLYLIDPTTLKATVVATQTITTS